ncbi:hypothetical protein BC834DRAFT_833182, partial [Gloeopeniophorella convolvens]
LVKNGHFPASPTLPRVSVSIPLLDLYFSLLERSGDAVTALSAALRTLYSKRGFEFIDDSGRLVVDPFRRSLSEAIQWYDQLCTRIDLDVESAIDRAAHRLAARMGALTGSIVCPLLLQRRCPACFGKAAFGCSLEGGGDIHVAVDANFHHRHRAGVAESDFIYRPQYFISKEEVDAMGDRVAGLRKRNSPRRPPKAPDEAVEECAQTYEAADGKKVKTNSQVFDDTGLCALVCRHDIPLFLANVDTPGEQQKYALALIEHLFNLLPQKATVTVLYDIGCVVDRSVNNYDIFPESVTSRLAFATSAMHAYGHQWSCQLAYNPRFRCGMGLTDGEGVERLWSKLRKLIPLTRSSSRPKRLWLIDRQLNAINTELRCSLGSWVANRLRNGVAKQHEIAENRLQGLTISTSDLRLEWESQKASQSCIRPHVPTHIKKQIDALLSLQTKFDVIETASRDARSAMESLNGYISTDIQLSLQSLEEARIKVVEEIDSLQISLDIPKDAPVVEGVSAGFLRTLFMARDLKVNLRKRAVASFFEWDRLDQAVGGRAEPLGTRIHQQTRKAIEKRTPALRGAIKTFNGYCRDLEKMACGTPGCTIPIPHTLSEKLEELREDPCLHEDVWVTPSPGGVVPRWLGDKDVRKGIHAVIRMDRAAEEKLRLESEMRNLISWFGRELAAIQLAFLDPLNSPLRQLLLQKLRLHLLLRQRWKTPLVTSADFDAEVAAAGEQVRRLIGSDILDEDPYSILDIAAPIDDSGIEAAPVQRPPDPQAPLHADVVLILEVPRDIRYDSLGGLEGLRISDTQADPDCPISEAQDGPGNNTSRRRSPSFSPSDVARLEDTKGWLNDACINGCAYLLQRRIAGAGGAPQTYNPDCAVFSSWVFGLAQRLESESQPSTEEVWRHVQNTEYWLRENWILPIHHCNHWLLVVIRLSKGEIHCFDSFGNAALWEDHISTLISCVEMLRQVANDYGCHIGLDTVAKRWHLHLLTTQRLQNNNYDCGVWVLAVLTAVLRGFHMVRLPESRIPLFRQYLARLARLSVVY